MTGSFGAMLCDVRDHLLPGAGDGSESLEETVRHLLDLGRQGVKDVVLTSHFPAAESGMREIDRALSLQRERFREVPDPIGGDPAFPDLFLGQEILARAPSDLVGLFSRTEIGRGRGTSFLVELGFEPGFDALGVIRHLRSMGRSLIVPHLVAAYRRNFVPRG